MYELEGRGELVISWSRSPNPSNGQILVLYDYDPTKKTFNVITSKCMLYTLFCYVISSLYALIFSKVYTTLYSVYLF